MHRTPSAVIVKHLKKKEIDYIKSKLEAEAKPCLLKIFKILVASAGKTLSKEELYKKLYNKPYSESNDATIRNDLRMLRQKLDNYLIKLYVEKKIKTDDLFYKRVRLAAYKHFKIYRLFSEEYNATIEALQNNLAFGDALLVEQSALYLGYNHKLTDVTTYKEKADFFEQLATESNTTLEKFVATIYRQNQFYKAFSAHYKQLLGETLIAKSDDDSMAINGKEHFLSLYHYHRSKGLLSKEQEQIHHFLEAYHLLESYEHKSVAIIELLLNALLNVARAYMLNHAFENAALYLHKAIEQYLPQIEEYVGEEKLYSNYILALLNKYEYQKALDTIQQFIEKVDDESYINDWINIYAIIAHLGLNQPQATKSLFPINFTDIAPQHKIYYRLLVCFEYYLLNKLEDAIRELKNIISSKLTDEYGKQMTTVISFFKLTLTALNTDNATLTQENKEKIVSNIYTLENQLIKEANLLPILKWFIYHLEKNGIVERKIETDFEKMVLV